MNRPKKCITVQKARELHKTWNDTRAREIDRSQGYRDHRDFWFSLDDLQEYLDYVREKSAEQGVKNPGIRIFFSAYPKEGDKKSYSTVFLAPTLPGLKEGEEAEEKNENNYDIEPLNTVTGGWPPTDY